MSESVAAPNCPICQAELRPTWSACPHCGTALAWRDGTPVPRITATPVARPPDPNPAPVPAPTGLAAPRSLGLLGAALLAGGSFMPIVSMPIVGTLSWINNGKGDGMFAVGLAGVAALLALRYPRWLWVPGFLALALIGYSFGNVQKGITDMQRDQTGLSGLLLQSVSLQWGWLVLLAGALLLLGAAWQAFQQPRLRQL